MDTVIRDINTQAGAHNAGLKIQKVRPPLCQHHCSPNCTWGGISELVCAQGDHGGDAAISNLQEQTRHGGERLNPLASSGTREDEVKI